MAALGRQSVDEQGVSGFSALSADEITNEHRLAHQLDWQDQPASALDVLWKTRGGTLRARAVFHPDTQSIAWVEMGGDMHVQPMDCLKQLQHALQGVSIVDMPQTVMSFFLEHQTEFLGFTSQDVMRLLHMLSDKWSLLDGADFTTQQLNALMVYSPQGENTHQILSRASVMLVPYCAKPTWCKWRLRDNCTECGLCEVGEAYRLAREREMQVTTITNYEHLAATLTEMKSRDVQAYVGMCCSSFFIKRHRAFQEAGMSALLMDISGANCYELKQEEQAYAGQFQAEAQLDMDVLQQVIQFVPQVSKK
jgi:lipoate-protein ligase A